MSNSSATRCGLCRVRLAGGFCSSSGGGLEQFGSQIAVHVFKRGQSIFHTGAPPLALYVVRSGRVKVYKLWHDGEEQVLRLLGPGEIVGYRPLFSGEPYGASAAAVGETAVCILPRAVVHEMVSTLPGVALHLLEKLAHELRISEDLLMDLVRRPVRQRVARLLLTLRVDSQGDPDSTTILSRDLRRKDMARMVGTTPETLSRVLHAFAAAGIVTLAADRIRIRDQALLKRIAGEKEPRSN